MLALLAYVLPVLEAQLLRAVEDGRDDVGLVPLVLDLEGDLVALVVIAQGGDVDLGHAHAHAVQLRLLAFNLEPGAPVEAVALVAYDEGAVLGADRIAEVYLLSLHLGRGVLLADELHDVAVGLEPGRLLVVADLAVAVLYGVDQELQERDVQLVPRVLVDKVRVIEVVGD